MFLAFGFGRIYATREIKMWRHRIDPHVYPNIRFIRERRSYRTISTDFFPVFNSWLTSLWVLTCATVPRLRNILLWKALLFRLSAKRIRKQVWLANGCARCCVQGKLKGGEEVEEGKKIAIYESVWWSQVASSRGNSWENVVKLPKILVRQILKQRFQSFHRYDEFKVHETFPLYYPFRSRKIRLDGKGATTAGDSSVCWDTLEQRASNKRGHCAQMRWKEKGMAGNREERNEEEEEEEGSRFRN